MQVRDNSIVADFFMCFALLLAIIWVALGAYQLRSFGFDLTTRAIYLPMGSTVYFIFLSAGGFALLTVLRSRGNAVLMSTRTVCLGAPAAVVIAALWLCGLL